MELKNRDVLKMHNSFIEANPDKLSKLEQNFLYLCISQIDMEDTKFHMMNIHIKDLENISFTKKDYSQIKRLMIDLSRKGISYFDGETYCRRNFFQRLNYKIGSGTINAQLHEDLFDMLLQLKKGHFTQSSLLLHTSFRSKYSAPLYLLLKSQYDKRNKYEDYIFVDYTIDFLMKHFQLPKSYNLYNRMKEKFLQVTEKDINDNSDFTISFEPNKRGRKLEGIRFTVHKEEQTDSIALDFDKLDITTRVAGELDEISQKTIKIFDYDIEEIEKLINEYSKDIVENALFVMSNKDPKVFTNAFGYLKAIIENNAKN
jgi:plasmid replication initiation protein